MYHTPPEITRENEDLWFAIDSASGEVLFTTQTLDSLDKVADARGVHKTADYYKHSWYGKEIPPWSRHFKGTKKTNLTLDI